MTLLLVGLNHHTAPVQLREQFYLSGHGLRLAMDALTRSSHPGALAECAIVSTCNRLEIYGEAEDVEASRAAVVEFLSCLHNFAPDMLESHLYTREGRAAADHLMRVASGLDSLILGEPQILGQVGDALAEAQAAGTVGAVLSHLFAQAVHAGKRARTETDISRYTMSVSHAAVHLLRRHLGDLRDKRALVVGAGDMAELAIRALRMHGAGRIEIISRTYQHAQLLAERYHAMALEWTELVAALVDSDAVLCATGAPHTVVRLADVEVALARRAGRSLLLVDVAVPRDVDGVVGDLPGVMLHDIDDLHSVIDTHREQRLAAVAHVEAIIAQESADFAEWLNSRQIVPLIVDLRRKAESMADAEVEQALRRLDGLTEREQQIISQMAHRIVNKLLHAPTTTLRSAAASGEVTEYAQTVRELFALDDGLERASNG